MRRYLLYNNTHKYSIIFNYNITFLLITDTMDRNSKQITLIAAMFLITIQITTSIPAKSNSRPVHEIINEQSRIDEKIRPNPIPYANPLAGNSKQNAKLHAQNQQAMFNAERVRQHRAQLQRWTKAPPQVDSYMKAYQESQENHQLALEQQQSKTRATTKHTPRAKQQPRQEKRSSQEVSKITKADTAVKAEKNRNHRSYGSVEYQQHLQPKRYHSVYLSPGPTYDQGVTIKPNGNIGLSSLKATDEDSKLFTAAVESKTQYVFPKQYSQMQSYQSAQDIDALNLLLKKNANDQLSELSTLLKAGKHNLEESNKDSLNTPIDLYFYLKDNPAQALPSHFDLSTYAQISPNYASAYMPEATKDHTPITEEVDDIEDPNRHPRLKTYGLQSVLATQATQEETTTTKSNNYYKVEVASQTISAPYPHKVPHYYYKEQDEPKPTYEALHYAQPTYYKKEPKLEGDLSERYLHHNAQHTGVKHLTEDGTGVSAYGNDVSISCLNISVSTACNKTRHVRSALETDPFLVPNTVKIPVINNTKNLTPTAEPYRGFNYFRNKNRNYEFGTFVSTPNFPAGVANDYSYEDYEERPRQRRPQNSERYEPFDEEFDDYEDEEEDDHTSFNNRPYKPVNTNNQYQNYAPNHQNPDQKGSYSNRYNNFNQFPNFPQNNFPEKPDSYFPDSYGPPVYGEVPNYNPPKPQNQHGVPQQQYGVPQQNYGVPQQQYGVPQQQYGAPKPISYAYNNAKDTEVIEPVYMLTQSQLKHLVGDNNVNIQHYEVFQLPKQNKHKPKHTRKHKRRPSGGYRNLKKNIGKLHKFRLIK